MATNKIQIRRSVASASVPTLSNGELAFTQASNTLWIGAPDGSYTNIRIGGQMVPGTLTANQALVANSTSGIDKVAVGNLYISGQVSANGTLSNPNWGDPGYILTSAGSTSNVYWTPASAIGINPSAQYTFTNTISFTNTITFNSNLNVSNLIATNIIGYNNIVAVNGNTQLTFGNTSDLSNTILITANNNLNIYQEFGASISIGNPGPNQPGVGIYSVYAPQGSAAAVPANLFFVNTSILQIGNSSSYVNVSTATVYFNTGSVNASINSTSYTGKANNSDNFGGLPPSNYQTIAGLLANVAALGYATVAGLSSNVAKLAANTTSFVGNSTVYIAAANVVSNAQLIANLSNYITTTQSVSYLAANLANYTPTTQLTSFIGSVTANNANYLGTQPAANFVNTAQLATAVYNFITTAQSATNLSANLANYTPTSQLTTFIGSVTANNANYLGTQPAANFVNTAQLATSLSNYSLLTGANFTGTINAVAFSTAQGSSGYYTTAGGVIINSSSLSIGNSNINAVIASNSTVVYFTGTSYTANVANSANYLGTQPATNFVNTAQLATAIYGATGGAASQTYVDQSVGNAYSNAVSVSAAALSANILAVNAAISVVNSAIISNALATYITSTGASKSYTDGQIASLSAAVLSNSYANTLQLISNSATAYTNAIVYSTAYTDNSLNGFFARNGQFSGNNTFGGSNTIFNSNVIIGSTFINAPNANLNIKDITISGNLNVIGTLTSITSSTIQTGTSQIELADVQANTSTYTDALDFTLYGSYGNTANAWYSGIYRDHGASTGIKPVWKLFASDRQPTGIVDSTRPNYHLGTLQSYLEPYGAGGAFVANASGVTLAASSTYSVNILANNITLATPLAPTSGGTGLTSYVSGDLIYASSPTSISRLAIGNPGDVLQISSSNLPSYSGLDGGTF